MTQNDILILAKAGFTAQQIAALSVTQVPAAPTAPATPTAPVTPTALATPTAPAATAPLTYEQFQQELQKMALMGAQQSGRVETADSVLASIINPPTNTGEVK
jgi:hypothetical protein|nr:MAG TPA: hypothetical protein [Caudoviricetes sp.]